MCEMLFHTPPKASTSEFTLRFTCAHFARGVFPNPCYFSMIEIVFINIFNAFFHVYLVCFCHFYLIYFKIKSFFFYIYIEFYS